VTGHLAVIPALVAEAVVIGSARPQALELFQTLAGVARLRTSAVILPLRSNGAVPSRMNGLFTGPAVCQATDI
jgi:hypothetical protein